MSLIETQMVAASDAFQQNRLAMLDLIAKVRTIEQRTRDGKTFLVMVDPQAFREGCRRLLAELQRIKAEGVLAGETDREISMTVAIHITEQA